MIGKKDEELSKKFGARVEALRIDAGFSTRDFADTADIAHSTLYEIEAGNSNPTLSVQAAIAKALKMSLSELMNGL